VQQVAGAVGRQVGTAAKNIHVRHRLERYGTGRYMDYQTAGPAEIAAAIASEIGRQVDYRPVATDGGARAEKPARRPPES
jgi:hypothetical protein